MVYDEKTMLFLEEQIPKLAEAACQRAYYRTLAAGLSVTIAREGTLYEVFPDGTEKVVGHIDPPVFLSIEQRRGVL